MSDLARPDLPRQLLPGDVLGWEAERSFIAEQIIGIAVLDPDDRTVAGVPILIDRRLESLDESGAVQRVQIFGEDSSGALQVTVTRTAPGSYEIGVLYAEPDEADPAALAPALAFAARSVRPNRFALVTPEGNMLPASATFDLDEDSTLIPRLDFVEGLAYINRRTGREFVVPSEIGPQDRRQLSRARRLLNAETLVEHWSEVIVELPEVDAAHWLDDPHPHGWRLQVETLVVVDLLGTALDLGRGLQTFRAVRPAPVDRQPERAGDLVPGRQPLLLLPGLSNVVETKLVDLEAADKEHHRDILRRAAGAVEPGWPAPEAVDADGLDAAIHRVAAATPPT